MGSTLRGPVCEPGELLSCPVFIVDFGALEQRGSTHFLFHGLARINWLVPPIFLIPRLLNHLPLLGVEAPLSFPHGLPPLFWSIFTDKGLSPIIPVVFEIPIGY